MGPSTIGISSAMTEGIKLHVSCYCGNAVQDVVINKSSLPLRTHMCHCDSCRYTSGLLSILDVSVQTPVSPPDTTNLTSYRTSETLIRYFCSVCGAYMFYFNPSMRNWDICTGILDDRAPPIEIVGHIHVGDTMDGGLSTWLPAWGFRQEIELPRYNSSVENGEILNGPQWDGHANLEEDEKLEKLPLKCHCGGVEYYITRPNEDSKKAHSPYPDLLIPYHRAASTNDQDEKWWLRAGNRKYLAGLCACKTCRLMSGFPIQPWAFIPVCNIFLPDGSPFTYDIGSLQQYKSSEGVMREFCKTCGATVFWHNEERPDLIDVSAGILRAPSGARAEGWLDWHPNRVSFKEEAQDSDLAKILEIGLYEAHEKKF